MNNLTVVIPFFNGQRTIERLLVSLPPELPVLIVDDLSDEPYQTNRANTTTIRLKEKGYFTGAANKGIEACDTDVLILNQDVWLEGNRWLDWLEEGRRRYALMGESIAGVHPAWPNSYIHGTFMFARRDAIERVGLMDAEHYPLWGSTCDWQLRMCRADFEAKPERNVPGFFHERKSNEKYGSSIRQLLDRQPEMKTKLIRTPPTVSVVISCYNYGRYLDDAINSLIGGDTSLGHFDGQTFQGFEIIIVDDASQDDTAEIGQRLADDWKGIKYYRLPESNHPDGTPNNGTPIANNYGIRKAFGKYISILCADDMMEETRLADMLTLQEANQHSVIYDDMWRFKNGERFGLWPMSGYDFDKLLKKNFIHAGIMFPKKAWVEAKGYPVEMRYGREDWAFNVALGIAGYCGIHLQKPLYLYRREGHNRSLRNTNKDWADRFLQQMMSIFPAVYQGERPMGCCGGSRSGRKTTPAASKQGVVMDAVPGSEGFTLIQYQGTSKGDQTWYPPSGRRYEFGGVKKQGFVDSRDVAWFRNLVEYGKALFVEVKPKNIKVPAGIAEAVNRATDQPEENQPEPVDDVSETVDVKDPTEMTVREIRHYVNDLNRDELLILLDDEQNGLNRKTAEKYIVDAINALG